MVANRDGVREAGSIALRAIAAGVALFGQCCLARTETALVNGPRVFLLDRRILQTTRHRLWSGDQRLAPALAALEREAQESLKAGSFSVVDKSALPPSGDKHDFMSQAPYYWADTNSPDGRPYVRRDGERNPEIYKVPDRRNLGRMTGAVETLALAYYFTTNEAYADKAANLLRAWFLAPATRMNPNFEYAQAVPGPKHGKGHWFNRSGWLYDGS